MKYTLIFFFSISLLNVNFAQSEAPTTRAERSQIGQMEQVKKSAFKTLTISLERYREAVKEADKKSQSEIKKDILMRMRQIVATNKSLLKEAGRSEGNKTQVDATKNRISQQNVLLKKAEKSANAQETEQLMVDFLETLRG